MEKRWKRYIYLGDIHGNAKFLDFIQEYDDEETFFYLTGDLFDRGKNSYENFKKIQELHQAGKCEVVLGNHDLFFIFTNLTSIQGPYLTQFENDWGEEELKKVRSTFSWMYMYNGGDKTNESIANGYEHDGYEDKVEAYRDIATYLFENFGIIARDPFNNLIIHGGIPIMPNGDLVFYLDKDNNRWLGGVEALEWMSEGMKKGDYLSLCYIDNNIDHLVGDYKIDAMENGKDKFEREHYFLTQNDAKNISPVWYNNYNYEANIKQYRRHFLRKWTR